MSAGCDGGDPPGGRRGDAGRGGDAGGPLLPDADGDGIPDQYEGRATSDDTDGDGTPDYLDLDSDGDGIPDAIEGGRPGGVPVDSDGDGLPDFRDLDSDGNGIEDSMDSSDDIDGDGILDFADLDDDGDGIRDTDEIGVASSPTDTDGDGIPDYRDVDSDGDSIADVHENSVDTDRDGTPDFRDLDSDDDGISDRDEAGDDSLDTPPIDTDGDTVPNFRDADSDNDGLSDAAELAAGTDPFDADSDDDGVTDLVEVASGTDPLDGTDSPRTRGDFVFFEPYMEAPSPPRDTLDFATDIRVADVYFLMDTTGSMGSSVASLRASLSTFITEVRAEIPDVFVGIGDYKDYPVDPYGWRASDPFCPVSDFAYRNYQTLTGDASAAIAAMSGYTACGGNDTPESLVPALWAIASGSTLPGNSGTPAPPSCPAATFGYPCWRAGAVPIVVGITDVPTHNGPAGANPYSDASIGGHAPTFDEAVAAMTDRNIRFIGIGQGTGGRAHLEAISRSTGSVDAGGSPLYSTWSGGAIGTTVLNQIRILASQTRFDISIEYQDDTSDAIDSFAAFVDHIEANTAGDAARGCVAGLTAIDTDGDTFPDTFTGVTAGQRVCFDIVVRENVTVMPTLMPQLFRGTLRVLGDGFTELDSRDVFFLVPPTIPEPGGPD